MNNLLIFVLSLIGIIVIWFVLFGQKNYNKLIGGN